MPKPIELVFGVLYLTLKTRGPNPKMSHTKNEL